MYRLLIALTLLSSLVVLTGDPAPLAGGGRSKVSSFSMDGATDVPLDQNLVFQFRRNVKKKWVGHDWIRIRTEAGHVAHGTFFRGLHLSDSVRETVDVETESVVVIDPERLGPRLVDKIERKARADLVPRSIRYDLGATSDLNGARRVLHNLRERKFVTFGADAPNLSDLTDTAVEPGKTYDVEVGPPGKKPWFESSFTTVAADAAEPFAGSNVGPFAVGSTDPLNGAEGVRVDRRIHIRFSRPVDPRTLDSMNVQLQQASAPGEPVIPA